MGETPLLVAIRTKNVAMVDLLLEAGADPNGLAPPWFTPLLVAVKRRQLDICRRLLARGANPRFFFYPTGTDRPCGLLSLALDGVSLEMINLLLDAGAPVFQDDRRRTGHVRDKGAPDLAARIEAAPEEPLPER